MEIAIPLVLSFFLPMLMALGIARRRIDLTGTKICIRFGLATSVVLTLIMLMFVGQANAMVGGGLDAFILLLLVVPAGVLAFLLAAGGAAVGVSMARQK